MARASKNRAAPSQASQASPAKNTRSQSTASPNKRASPIKRSQPAAPPDPQPPSRVRKPPQCKKCTNDVVPHLRVDCPVYSKKGKSKALAHQARTHIQQPGAPPTNAPFIPAGAIPQESLTQPFVPNGAPPQTWDHHASQQTTSVTTPATPSRPRSIAPSGASTPYLQQRAGGVSSPFNFTSVSGRAPRFPPSASSYDPVIDPGLGPPTPATQPPSSSPVAPSSPARSDMALINELPALLTRKSRKKVQPGEFGYVQNVAESLKEIDIPRKHRAPTVAENKDIGTRAFSRRIKTVLESCEDVSIHSGACIFVGAYYATQRSDRIYTYTSPGLVHKDNEFAIDISTNFYQKMRSIGTLSREEKRKLEAEVAEANAKAKESNEKAKEYEQRLDAAEAELNMYREMNRSAAVAAQLATMPVASSSRS